MRWEALDHRLLSASRTEHGQHVLLFRRFGLGTVAEQLQALLRRHGPREQKTLSHGTTEPLQNLGLLISFDALGDYLDLQVPRNGNDRAHDREIARVGDEVAHEAAVDLERVHAPVLEITQTRISGSEVVDG